MKIKYNGVIRVKFIENDSPLGKDRHERQSSPDRYPATVANKENCNRDLEHKEATPLWPVLGRTASPASTNTELHG